MHEHYVPREPREVGEYTFFADFENATDTLTVRHEGGCYTVAPGSWLHFGVRGVAGERPTFRTERADHVDERRKYVWSPDGDEWRYFDDARVDDEWYYVDNDAPFESDTVSVAGLFPYPLGELEELLRELRDRHSVTELGPRGYTPDRNPLYGLRISDPDVPDDDKHDVVAMAGQHAWEAWGRQVFHGFLERVTSDAPVAQSLREKAVVHAYPMANPDGITRGHVRDGTVDANPNREWLDAAPPEGEPSAVPEVNVLRRAIFDDTGGEAAYLVDCHSHAGWYDHCMWFADEDDPVARAFVDAVYEADDEHEGGAIHGREMVGGDATGGKPTSKRWAYRTLDATGLTFEATPYSSPSRERYRRAGDAFVAGFDAVLD